jgi:hypothetical protein
MDATLYTGTGASLSVTNAGGFSPDLVWIKSRSNSYNNELYDSVRGTTKRLISNLTNAESTSTNGLTAFNSNGFTQGGETETGANGATYVGWQWRGSDSAAVSNTAGSITSTVSANTSAGFSVVTCTSPASAGSFTFGHGLGVAPKFIISKSRSGTGNWSNYHVSTGAGGYLLFTTAAYTANTDTWNNTTPTSTLISSTTNWWGTSSDLVFYCWAEVAGYSKFGSYTGNGSTDGPFVYTGFRPRYILWKNASAVHGWYCYDTARQTYNAMVTYLSPTFSDAEATNGGAMDILSNGFKVRNTGGDMNASGNTIIYMAFAESPFKYSLAR